jgi:hypothetical protein
VCHLLAASAFAIWAAIVAGLSVFLPERSVGARRMAPAELLGLALCAAATLFWCWDLVQVPQVLARDGVLTTWTDQFIHGAKISQFGDPRAAGRQAVELADLPMPAYHYASYMLPAAFAWPLDLPGLPLATSVWVPLGFFTLCAGIYVLGASLAGPTGGVAALAALTLMPDAGLYGLHNRAFGYYWYMLEVPGAAYAVGVCLLSIAFLQRWGQTRDPRALVASAALVGASCLFRVHIFLLAFPAWLPSVAMLTGLSLRRKLLFLAATSAALALFVFGYYRLFPDAVPALTQFLYVVHTDHFPTAYEGWYAALVANLGTGVGAVFGVLLVLPACLGVFLVLYPLSVLLMRRSRGLAAIDFVPVAVLSVYTLLMIAAPVPANGDPTELTQRPFVLFYAIIAIWTAAGGASWLAAQGGLGARRAQLALLLTAGAWVILLLHFTIRDARWLEDHKVAPGLPQAAQFLRSHARSGDIVAVQGLTHGRVTTDVAIQLVSLTGVPSYLSRPFIHIGRGGRDKEVALQRHAALVQVAEERGVAAALMRLRQAGVQWYAVAGSAGPRWDPERRHAAFAASELAIYSSNPSTQ